VPLEGVAEVAVWARRGGRAGREKSGVSGLGTEALWA
jgi:hypothetical protein